MAYRNLTAQDLITCDEYLDDTEKFNIALAGRLEDLTYDETCSRYEYEDQLAPLEKEAERQMAERGRISPVTENGLPMLTLKHPVGDIAELRIRRIRTADRSTPPGLSPYEIQLHNMAQTVGKKLDHVRGLRIGDALQALAMVRRFRTGRTSD